MPSERVEARFYRPGEPEAASADPWVDAQSRERAEMSEGLNEPPPRPQAPRLYDGLYDGPFYQGGRCQKRFRESGFGDAGR